MDIEVKAAAIAAAEHNLEAAIGMRENGGRTSEKLRVPSLILV